MDLSFRTKDHFALHVTISLTFRHVDGMLMKDMYNALQTLSLSEPVLLFQTPPLSVLLTAEVLSEDEHQSE